MAASDVIVVDDRSQFLERVAPAVARYALKHQHARVLYKTPFTIQLARGLDACPRPPRTERRAPAPEVIRIERINMSNFNPASTMETIVEFFERVDRKNGGDGVVWVKATAPRGQQVILEIRTQQGRRLKVPPIRPGDPVCLSKYATFDVIRDAEDVMQCWSNGIIKLMSSKEANDFFAVKAGRLKTTPEALKQKADQDARAALNAKPLKESEVDDSLAINTEYVNMEDVINPRLIYLCQQVSPMLKEEHRMPVNALQAELLDIEESLTLMDLEYIRANGFYPTIKKWAAARQAAAAQAEGLAPALDALSDSPDA